MYRLWNGIFIYTMMDGLNGAFSNSASFRFSTRRAGQWTAAIAAIRWPIASRTVPL